MKLYTTKQVAKMLQVSRQTLIDWFQKKYISEIKRDWSGARMFTSKDIEKIREFKNKYFYKHKKK